MSIKLTFSSSHKSIAKFNDIVLPDITILTGANGSGKTHFLEAIAGGRSIRTYQEKGDNKRIINRIKYISNQNLFSIASQPYAQNRLKQLAQPIINACKSYQNAKSKKLNLDLTSVIRDKNISGKIKRIADELNIPIDQLKEDDFISPSAYFVISNDDILRNNCSEIFKVYYDALENNRYSEYRFNQYGERDRIYITDDEFYKANGNPPWDTINSIFRELRLDYTVTNPSGRHRELNFEAELKNSRGVVVKFNELSSGEKAVVALAISLYKTAQDSSSDIIPELLLLDEPDASLHPSMIQSLLNIVNSKFVNEFGIKVIIATHSPSTVAMAGEESLYVMKNQGGAVLEKITKDKALYSLTSGIPFLSVSADNRKQVVVESDNDQKYYEEIYNILRDKISGDSSLCFISTGIRTKNGDCGTGCVQVKKCVSSFEGSGSKTVYGVIDWDNTNSEDDRIKILGNGSRYSIENYILDPLIMAIYLQRERIDTDILDKSGTDKYEFNSIKSYENNELQHIVDKYLLKIKPEDCEDNGERRKSTYLNGKYVSLPKWYLEYKGHDLVKRTQEKFLGLKKFQTADSLLKDIISKAFHDHSEFISVDFLKLFERIVNYESIKFNGDGFCEDSGVMEESLVEL